MRFQDREGQGRPLAGTWRPTEVPVDELGAVVHGPVLLARGPDVAAGLRCVLAHRDALHLPVVFRARGAALEGVQSWSYGRIRGFAAQEERSPYSEPRVVVVVDGERAEVRARGALQAGDDRTWGRDATWVVPTLPRDGLLRVTVSWPEAGLPETGTDLLLDGLGYLDDTVVRLF